jgi:predicted transcriptional regulator
MPNRAPHDPRIVSVRLPDDLIQRLDRYLDWCATSRRRHTTRHAAIREAWRAWLDDHEQRAGLVEPHTLRQQFQAAYQRLHPHHDGVPIHQLRHLLQWPRERFDTILEALRAAQQVDLEVGTARELGPQALADSYQVHGQLYVRVRWRT